MKKNQACVPRRAMPAALEPFGAVLVGDWERGMMSSLCDRGFSAQVCRGCSELFTLRDHQCTAGDMHSEVPNSTSGGARAHAWRGHKNQCIKTAHRVARSPQQGINTYMYGTVTNKNISTGTSKDLHVSCMI